MRWTIPTLVQALVDAGVSPSIAAVIVGKTYDRTQGDDDYCSRVDGADSESSWGPYAIRNQFAPSRIGRSEPTYELDATVIASQLAGSGEHVTDVVDLAGSPTAETARIAVRAASLISGNSRFVPTQVPVEQEHVDIDAITRTAPDRLAGAVDAIRSVSLPYFGN